MNLNIAIIPARGGSKRLPNKNKLPLAGKPLITWTIEAALESQLFDLVLVSTDSQDIANISADSGAIVPFLRPAELATDTATTNDVISNMVKWVESQYREVARVTLLQPTSPLRNANHIKGAMALYNMKNASAVISVCELEHPIQYCNRLPDNLSMAGFIPTIANRRSQELERYYRVNGAIYIFDRQYVGSLSDIYSSNSFAYIMEKSASIDIDDAFDLYLSECIKNRKPT
ncbi:acylneuraminate cytidylyltransferase family protein [Aeromonas taiwanensis]|uniref:Acylneuraminate cytidylyltransferase family protein n=1 Tax=Aeromonas taiwanensis TaxID=633417 RepID=A0A5F0K9R6_9GAMM|nr:acylneuraminate cytidylyltransferase family protein [Aeromonas taiwanensis]TFF74463.1 acylneuraminate cytidylyltransferase family protein [Aeromonas taiwanensis]TFF75337.1 acylneuraminate cytidylyltransferase family protein [Aeromonas taiwanensis]TFF78713.1 acylneuraminate cytidylyltransferase family protein [Aeromonas taiwanensis]